MTPKLVPAPRIPQNNAGFEVFDASIRSPFAVTKRTDDRASMTRPWTPLNNVSSQLLTRVLTVKLFYRLFFSQDWNSDGKATYLKTSNATAKRNANKTRTLTCAGF